jgi:ribosomal protein S18 acetylase RimI-like enzyme
MTEIYAARFPEHLDSVRSIFREYAESLNIDLGFQDFEAELAGLPGKFAAPRGRILLAENDGQVIGCIALRPLDDTLCEMKRLYIRPSGRGHQLGKKLAMQICHIAQEAGYSAIRLDTLSTMVAARQLYVSLGFKEISAYVFNPHEDALYMELDLQDRRV